MAKRVNDSESGASRGKIRFIIAEVEGNDQTLQDLVRTMAPMLSRPVHVQIPPKRVVGAQDAAKGSGSQSEDTLFGTDPEVEGQPGEEAAEPAAEGTTETPRRKRGDGSSRDRNAGLTVVKSLNLQPTGKETLKEFVSRKKPKSQEEHIAVYVYYLKNVLEEPSIGFSHVYTCFKETGERMPGDLPQTCRNAASKKGWLDTSDSDDLKRTTRGDNLVEKDLPRTASVSEAN